MRRIIVATAAVLALVLASTAAAWEGGEPPTNQPPPAPAPPSQTRLGYCLPGNPPVFVNIAADEEEAYKARGATPAVNGDCADLPGAGTPSGDLVPPGEAGPASPPDDVTRPKPPKPIDYCKQIGGRQSKAQALRLRAEGWTVNLSRRSCIEPPPDEKDLTG